MVLAYHAIWSAYGFWLPNDQRGSWSTEVWAPKLRAFGPATKTTERRSLAGKPFDRDLRREMRATLKYPPVRFTLAQIDSIARGFAASSEQFGFVLYACAIVWDHVHIVSKRHEYPIETVARILKLHATRQLTRDGIHPLARFAQLNQSAPTPWAKGGWKRYLNDNAEIEDAVDYVNGNPRKHGLADQRWSFVTQQTAASC
jgi:REP element-mobilizing transposase RayT